jgi:cellulose synthase (UDP-forming)
MIGWKPTKRDLINALEILAMISILVYLIVRSVLYCFADYNLVERIFSVLLIFAEFFLLIHSIGYAMDVFRASRRIGEKGRGDQPPAVLKDEPSVAILVAARHEPKEVLENTFISLKNLRYKNKYIYFLDDSSDEKYKREAEALCEEHGLILFRREERHGAKAGIVNDCMKTLNQKYVSIFDADQCPLPEFLNALVPILEGGPRIAFVQTPQYYSNIDENRIARAAGFQQAVFYEYICEGKGTDEAMFCCGTNVVFRREALLDVGGLDESTVTEDFATSIKLHARGWQSRYHNHVYAFGMGPEDLASYFKQQFRWSTGTISVLKRVIRQFILHPFSMRIAQWWEYLLSGSYYLIGISFAIIMICPIAYILFKIPSFFARPDIYFLAFLPYIILSMSVYYAVLSLRHYSPKDLFLGQLLGFITFFVYIKGAVSALLGVKTTFGVTGKTKGNAIPYYLLWPQMSMLFLNFIAFVWGINRFVYEHSAAVAVNGFWTIYHCALLSSVFYFNAAQTAKKGWQTVPKGVEFTFKVIGEEPGGIALKRGFTVSVPRRLAAGTRIMCKLTARGGETVVFDGKVLSVSGVRSKEGYETDVGIATITQDDGMRLKKMLSYD